MIKFLTVLPWHFRKKNHVAFLFFFWLSGLLIGFSFFLVSKPFSFSMMRSILCIPVSIVGLSLTIFLPLFLSYFSLVVNKPFLALVSCFLKAFSFGFTYSCFNFKFHSASWLIRSLFMFSGSISSILLIVQCCNYFNRELSGSMRTSAYFFLGLLTLLIDCFFISPLLLELF